MRPRKNRHEEQFEKTARAAGWNVTKRGWPDFVCWRTNSKGKYEFVFVEVKPESKTQRGRYQRPTAPQMMVLAALHQAGFDVRISDGSDLGARWSHALLAKGDQKKVFDGIRNVSKRIRIRDGYAEHTIQRLTRLETEKATQAA